MGEWEGDGPDCAEVGEEGVFWWLGHFGVWLEREREGVVGDFIRLTDRDFAAMRLSIRDWCLRLELLSNLT